MSHFTVTVLTDDSKGETLEQALAPFHEYETTGENDQYVQDVDITEQALVEHEQYNERCDPRDVKGFAEFIEYYYNYHLLGDNNDTGMWGHYEVGEHGGVIRVIQHTNPNAKWDWYQLGGRWSGKLQTTGEGVKGMTGIMGSSFNDDGCDTCLLSELDLEGMMLANIDAATARWDANFPDLETKLAQLDSTNTTGIHGIQQATSMATMLWGYQYGDTRDSFVKRVCGDSPITTFAIVYNGEWIERGEMGWWASVSNEKEQPEWDTIYNGILDKARNNPHMRISIVDCHI